MSRAGALIALGFALVWAAPATAAPGRISVGLAPSASAAEVALAVQAATGGRLARDLGPLRALIVSVADVEEAMAAARTVPGVEYAEPVEATRRLAFQPTDPLVPRQWYLPFIRAFDFWAEKPPLAPVLIAVIDSGIDASHPEFQERIFAARSFVSDPETNDAVGHGTMVAGEIAAALDNGAGIAGVAFPAQLLVAKVVSANGSISLEAEARAIRWAVDQGARVINLSLGGPRDPNNPERDTYSALEQSAIDYATSKGAVVVAATGNCQVVCPYRFASYPAALPHVLGVSAVSPDDSTPSFSNRDELYNDIAAPGKDIVSTFPFALSDPNCPEHGYTPCATVEEYRRGEGTSFAAPLVSAAAGLLLGQRALLGGGPLEPSQVIALLERSAVDIQAPGRDRQSGNGRLDVAAALASLERPLPPPDRYETNDDAGSRAYPLWGPSRVVTATLDFYQDAADVYRVKLRAGQLLELSLRGPFRSDTDLVLWKPGTSQLPTDISPRSLAKRADLSSGPGARERIVYRVERGGWYYVEVRIASEGGRGQYRLALVKR